MAGALLRVGGAAAPAGEEAVAQAPPERECHAIPLRGPLYGGLEDRRLRRDLGVAGNPHPPDP